MSQPTPTPTPTPAQVQAAEAFLAAFNAFNASDATTRKATDKALTSALNRYRLAHRLSGAMGLLDCINHYNATHASEDPQPAKVVEQHDARRAWRDQVRAYRKAKAEGTLPPATPPAAIGDVGGYDLNGNPL